jgi:hypothetical protein
MRVSTLLYPLVTVLCPFTAHASEADVLHVEVKAMSNRLYQFQVTVSHADEGWDHYADKWDVVAPDGTVLGSRTLFHPHENEQPFTRNLAGVKVPENVTEVTLRAHDTDTGYGGKTLTVTLPR